MLTVAPLTMTFPFALTTYLFVAHTLDAPNQALSASLLAGGVTALVGLFCIGLIKDTADTLYMCYCIDKDVGTRHRDEVFAAFEYESQRRPAPPPSHAGRSAPAMPSTPIRTPQPPAWKPPIPQPQPQFSVSEPRRTQRLEPPAREETPDPFDHAPVDPFSPESSPDLRQSQSYRQSEIHATSSLSIDHGHPSITVGDDESLDGEESQLFPGSDLF
ncbi:hypothetical protein EW026_g6536 [Hermanssonia centrifuga]|uniref:Protein PNS1 n=1 Tax=Hermanssonia centrifuga TaxID=98765 RepID=A0A4S4KAS0_9APHY|nr:hypothetical protein EW026_g6536 [Hermanssonia centrifuga]